MKYFTEYVSTSNWVSLPLLSIIEKVSGKMVLEKALLEPEGACKLQKIPFVEKKIRRE